jgi:hypothetical protein
VIAVVALQFDTQLFPELEYPLGQLPPPLKKAWQALADEATQLFPEL